MFVAPQGILSQVQLYWLKQLPQENLDTETLMGPYVLGLCNILFYLFIVVINKNASLTAQMNFLSNYSHLLFQYRKKVSTDIKHCTLLNSVFI